ncbi:MAG: nucleotide exchange factor GrpE [Veillonellaceae bacterium]|jgi:molecular chaperone GrpE|uniref:nucleotide exchange factor GrpE n=2 Tax=uncultured Selenomonas sp. TaxID=159275 RepID=UPI0025DBE914|nr:nucleotide exchange factor GrpE [uncultured Selenomonas sp.]MCI6100054.1 nucleotide exchange factor GrpE [Selenomonas sp.]MCI7541156.1 nucleotide exchange factor GrpE [Veillonellaceae bacterium]
MKDEMSKKDEQKLKEMQKEIDEAEAAENAGTADADAETADAPEGAESADGAAEAAESAEDLQKKVETLAAALQEKDNRLKRLQADFENFRRRTSKEREEIGNVVTQELLKNLLPIVDNFDRAMATEQQDGEAFKKGVEMIYTQLGETLKNVGLEPIETEGQKFDPNFHQAVMRVENPDLDDDTIAQELQKGYIVKGKVIRPSMVQVVSNS